MWYDVVDKQTSLKGDIALCIIIITLNHNIRRGIWKFSEKISKNLAGSKFKFVAQMIFGMLGSQSCMLSEISRNLSKKTTLKK